MRVFLFPGQGSQQLGMGQELFDRFPDLVTEADAELGYSIKTLCLQDPDGLLNQTQYTQPALYIVNALSYLQKGQRPDAAVGHSLGEYNALWVAGVFDFITGLRLVKQRAMLMQQMLGGAMAAVIGLSAEQIQMILQREGFDSIDLANFNAPNQIVISGPQADILASQNILEQQGALMVIPLKVSGAFHSRYMTQAKNTFSQFLKEFSYKAPEIPVISNVNARPYEGADVVISHLAEQLASPVRWCDSIRFLAELGEVEFQEVGPGKVLTGMLRHILT